MLNFRDGMAQISVHQQLYKAYDNFKSSAVAQRRFTLAELQFPLRSLSESNTLLSTSTIGKSVEGRPIFMVKAGDGKTKVLLWSQMHGDEPTATAAMLDIFNFLKAEPDSLQYVREAILENTSLYFIPMLNPDGAQQFQRRNALDIDLNRDALRLASPESKLLKEIRDSIQADWGFNLHDQNRRYAAGPKGDAASITLLAPPIDHENSVNKTRKDAMHLVVLLYKAMQHYLPNGVGRWNDEFEPRAFGENMQLWGTRTVLIEAGGFGADWEKQEVRRLNFVAILYGLYGIATGAYKAEDMAMYAQIPQNDKRYFDLLIRNAAYTTKGYTYNVDVGIDWEESELPQGKFYNEASVEDMGDLSTFKGFAELNAEGMQLLPGKLLPDTLTSVKLITKKKIKHWLMQGYTGVIVKNLSNEMLHSPYPINLYSEQAAKAIEIKPNQAGDLVLIKDDKVKYVVINGYIVDPNLKAVEIEAQGRVEK